MENQVLNQKNHAPGTDHGNPSELSSGTRSMMPPAFQLMADGEENIADAQASSASPSPLSIRTAMEPPQPRISSEWLADEGVEEGLEMAEPQGPAKEVLSPDQAADSSVQMAEDAAAKGIKVTHATRFAAPDGGASSRTKVGVGEVVSFKSNKKGNWTASTGTISSGAADSKKMVWSAPAVAGNSSIKVTDGTETKTIEMTVIAPGNVTADKLGESAFTAGEAGAGMFLKLIYNPLDVSFGNIQVKEVSGPATNVTGYFTRFSAVALRHNSGDSFFGIGSNNRDSATDEASLGPIKAPFLAGTFDWLIPYNFRIGTDASTEAHFTDVTQAFQMAADGTITINKAGKSVTRKP
jgi:hypothetical protein